MASVPMREASTVSRALPEPGLYRHFKGGEYEVLKVARHSETEELLVIYCSLDDPATTWVRPVEMFSGDVESEDGTFPRFELTARSKRHPDVHLIPFLLRVLKFADPRAASSMTSAPRLWSRRSSGARSS
jgi:hypothetical protein